MLSEQTLPRFINSQDASSTDGAPVALEMVGVSFAYSSRAGRVPVLHDVSVTVSAGVGGDDGPSGSGKSTALLCAASLCEVGLTLSRNP